MLPLDPFQLIVPVMVGTGVPLEMVPQALSIVLVDVPTRVPCVRVTGPEIVPGPVHFASLTLTETVTCAEGSLLVSAWLNVMWPVALQLMAPLSVTGGGAAAATPAPMAIGLHIAVSATPAPTTSFFNMPFPSCGTAATSRPALRYAAVDNRRHVNSG